MSMTDIEYRARAGYCYIETARNKLGLEHRNDGDSWRDIAAELADELSETHALLKSTNKGMFMKAYGYFICLNEKRVVESETLYLSKSEVRKEMLGTLPDICRTIADGDDADVFDWPDYDGTFNPNYYQSCDCEDDFARCMVNYERVRSLIADKITPVGDMAAIVEVPDTGGTIRRGENGFPYTLEWEIVEYNIQEKYEKA
jgi:hypothetical protein